MTRWFLVDGMVTDGATFRRSEKRPWRVDTQWLVLGNVTKLGGAKQRLAKLT
jgi:hypothetical protein